MYKKPKFKFTRFQYVEANFWKGIHEQGIADAVFKNHEYKRALWRNYLYKLQDAKEISHDACVRWLPKMDVESTNNNK